MSQSRDANSSCNLCGSDSFELIATLDRKKKPLETVVCRDCGLVRHADIPTDEQLAEFYGTRYRQEYHGETKPSDRRVMRAWKNAERIFTQIFDHVAQAGRVLEVGAGIGCTVRRFQAGGFDAWGVEPHVGFCEYGHKELGANLANQSLEDIRERENHDLVLLVHVIEHFNSPRSALESIRNLLKPKGLLYVECPNLAAPFATESNLFHYAHIHNFTPITLAAMANRCGYEVVANFSDADDANLQMLLRRRESLEYTVPNQGYAETKDALRRSQFLPYHMRWAYLSRRLKQLAMYGTEHLMARGFVAGLRSKLHDGAVVEEETTRRAA